MSDVVEVYVAKNAAEAHMLVLMLSEHDIEARVVGETLPGLGVGGVPAGALSAPAIWTTGEHAEKARSLILDWEQKSNSKTAELDPRGWACPLCGTEIESGVYICWKCHYNPAAC